MLELAGERGATAPRWNVHAYHLHSEFYADFGLYDAQLTVPDGWPIHITWAAMALAVMRHGPGRLSVDHLFARASGFLVR